MGDLPTLILVGLVGLAVGSFLNVCIYRLPRNESLAWPGSHCPQCRTPLRWYDNVPLLGYAFLRGRCRTCRQPIPFRYFLVELTTAVAFVSCYAAFGLSALLVVRLLFVSAMIVLAVTDIEHRILPNSITYPGIVAGLLFSTVLPPGWISAAIGVVSWPVALFLLGEAVSRAMKRDALGFGDVKMLAMIGAFLGWRLAFLTVFASSLLGTVFGLLGIAILGRDRYYQIPLGTFLALAATLMAIIGQPVLDWYLAYF
jgi:leader peptidase (prepilin peptidase)/N-methyltransferase